MKISMAAVYRLIVTFLLTSAMTSGYRTRRLQKSKRFRNGMFGHLDSAYEFFSRNIVKKPVLSEIHILPPIYIVEDTMPQKFAPNVVFPPQRAAPGKGKHHTKGVLHNDSNLKRPLVHLLSRTNSEIGKAIDKFFNKGKIDTNLETERVATLSVSPDKTADTLTDNKAPLLQESFPVPLPKVVDVQTLDPAPPGPYRNCFPPSVVVCGARLPWAHVHGMSDWCEQNCDKEAYTKHCDDIRCTCKCLAPGEPF